MSTDHGFVPLRDLERFGRLDDALGQSCAQALRLGYADGFDQSVLRGRVDRLRLDLESGSVPPFSIPRLGDRGLVLGRDARGKWVRQPFDRLEGHLLVLGSSGASKTTWVIFLLAQLLTSLVGLLAVDAYKKSLRVLRTIGLGLGREVIVIRAHDDRFNLLDPGQLDPRTHMQLTLSLLVRTLGLPGVARALLQNALFDLYSTFGLFNGPRDHAPTLFHVWEHVRSKMPDANHAARESLLERLASLLVSMSPKTAAWTRGWRHADLEDKLVVLELGAASEWHRALRVSSTLLHLMHLRNQTGRGEPLLVVGDDVLPLLQGAGVDSGGLTPLAEALTLVRSAKLGFWALAQSLAGIDPALIANLNNKVVGRLASAHDWSAIARETFLDPRQLSWARAHLEPGTLLVHLAHGHREPFPISVPYLPPPAAPDDAEVLASQRALDHLPTSFAEEFREWSPRERIKVVNHSEQPLASQAAPPERHPQPEAAPPTPSRLSHDERRVLAVVDANPGVKSSVLPKLAQMSPKRFRVLRTRLVREGFLAEVPLQTSPTGRPSIVLELTADGRAALAGGGS